jgi:hypothetical protein
MPLKYSYTNAYVYQVSGDGSVLVGSALVSGARKPMVWRINAASLSQGFYWLSAIAQQTTVLDTGVSSYLTGLFWGSPPTARWAAATVP